MYYFYFLLFFGFFLSIEGVVCVRTDSSRLKKSKRIVFLFKNWLLLCKKQRPVLSTVVSLSTTNLNYVLKLKCSMLLDQILLVDLADEVGDNGGNFMLKMLSFFWIEVLK